MSRNPIESIEAITDKNTGELGHEPPSKASSGKKKKVLISDIKPVPIKDRSQQGIVELILDEGTKVQAVGVIYGMRHTLEGDGFKATVFLDHYNQRIRILNYQAENFNNFILIKREHPQPKCIYRRSKKS